MIRKTFINVIAQFTASGRLEPMSVIFYDGRTMPVDRIVDVSPAANLKVGGRGTRYRCMIGGKRRCLWLEENRWFVEEEVQEEA